MSLWIEVNQLLTNLIVNTNRLLEGQESQVEAKLISSPTNPFKAVFSRFSLSSIEKHWRRSTAEQKKLFILSAVTLITGYYILAPTLFPSPKMFTKRPDKHTTGLINLRNDCFANSSLQAYSSLPGLTEYINSFVGSYNAVKRLVPGDNKLEEEIEKDAAKRGVPLHIALAKIVKKLQETSLTSRTISVWTFLHTLEAIFHAKISRSQHDAHELTQLINETLENENLRLQKFVKKITDKEYKEISEVLKEQIDAVEVPEFPFSGLTLTHMVCLKCKHVSKPSFVPFLMLTLNTPEQTTAELEKMITESESETIEGYQCLKCRISEIAAIEKKYGPKGDDTEFVAKITQYDQNPQFCINEDLPKDLEEYIKSYNKNGLDISKVTSTVLRKNQILKPPKIFGIHLSRSSFDGVSVTRNACRVAFKDHLTLSIGKEYSSELQKFQTDDEERHIESKVLTTDVNDMEDEDVQREDIDEKGEEDDDEVVSSSATETDTDGETVHTDGTAETDETDELEDGDDDDASLTSNETADRESVATNATLKGASTTTGGAPSIFSNQPQMSAQSSRAPDTLNNAPITEDQTDNLKEHFKSFKFNDNDVYKYRLKALIRHQGSHTQGHYECYKRKPLFVKDKEGTIFKLSPEVEDEVIGGEVHYNVSIENGSDGKKSSDSMERSQSRSQSISNGSGPSAEEIKGSQFRRKFSTMMSRRPSVIQAQTQDSNIQEIIDSGLQTPAELLVDNPEPDYFGSFKDPFNKNGRGDDSAKHEKKVKMTKIPSLIKNPYWRISDSQVIEVSKTSVLFETTSVYMLYYERVDRNQIKSR